MDTGTDLPSSAIAKPSKVETKGNDKLGDDFDKQPQVHKEIEKNLKPEDRGEKVEVTSRSSQKTRDNLKLDMLKGNLSLMSNQTGANISTQPPPQIEVSAPDDKLVDTGEKKTTEPNRETAGGYRIDGQDDKTTRLLGSGKFGSVFEVKSNDDR